MTTISSGTTTTTAYSISADTTGKLVWQTNGTTTALTIDTNQNMGLGVTPSSWGSSYKALQIGTASALWGSTGTNHDTNLGSNIYFNGTGNIYIVSDYATQYQQYQGKHQWFTAASGTAGNAITFGNPVMTLNNSGYLGIGTSSPSTPLHIVTAGTASTYTPAITVQDNTYPNSGYPVIRFETWSGGNNYYTGISGAGGGYLQFYTTSSYNSTPNLNMTLDPSGNLYVGTTGSGNLNTGRLRVLNPSGTSQDAIKADQQNGGNTCYWGNVQTTGSYLAYWTYQGGNVGTITTNGSSTSYNTSSDRRLKSNIASITTAQSGPIIDALQPRSFTWNVDGSADVGFIADEVQAIIPKAVTGAANAVDAEGKPVYQMIDMSQPELIAYLVAEVQSLRARLKAANIA